jgi:crotonobetainyl-CoA:carnitine CoA-transferase CaiB-like acyl-CoA transferase
MNQPFATESDADLPPRPLAGVRIIEACTYLAGPYCAMMLADLGADVIKVEPPSGDPYRSYAHTKEGLSAVWINGNRGKRAVTLNLKDPQDSAKFKELLKSADVFIENWRPRVADSLDLSLASVAALNPRLIRLSITGYGESGPRADDPAFDALLQGSTGIVASLAANGRPNPTPFFIADKVSALYASQAVLAALHGRAESGKGSHVKLAMLDLMAYFNFPELFYHRTFEGDTAPYRAPPSSVLQTSDGFIVLSPVSGQQLGKTLEVIGHPEWKEDFRKIKDRVEMANQFFIRIAGPLLERSSAEWIALFAAVDVPVGPVCGPDAHLEDEQVKHNQLYSSLDSPAGPVRAVRYPAIFDERMLTPQRSAPGLGQHNEELLGTLQAPA